MVGVTYGFASYGLPPVEKFEPIVEIGKFCSLAGGIHFWGNPHHHIIKYPKCVTTYPFMERWGERNFYRCAQSRKRDKTIRIGNDVWIGDDVLVMDGVTIGDGVIVGARAVVTKDVPPYAVIVGNPAVIKKYRYAPQQIESLQMIKWWDWDEMIIRERMEDFKDIEVFIEKYGNTTV